MVRDGVANIVSRLREFGFDPRNVGEDAWRSRCPAHRGLDYALSITRNEFNHVVITCRSAQNCTHPNVIRALGLTNELLYAETPDWLISQLQRIADGSEERAETEQSWEPPQIGDPTEEAVPSVSHEPSHVAPLISESLAEAIVAALDSDYKTSRTAALGSRSSTAVDTVKESPTDALMRMAGVERVIVGSDGRSYALVSSNGKVQCRELKSKGLRNVLTHAALKATGKLPTPEAIAAVVGVLEANAEFDGTQENVSLRVARGPSGLSYLLDLADREGRIIEIRPDGWELAAAPPVFFRRTAGQLELPLPARGGSLDVLKKYVNVEEDDWPLFIGWLTAALRPVGPHPILVITGEQGAAKTTTLRVCRRLIDPNASPVRAQPKELRDLMIAARKSWLMAYDNITTLPAWLSNGLCGLATGTGFTIRSLGTDDDETIFVAQRPVIINGINDFVEKADLGDRSFFLDLPPIPPSMRRTEEDFWADFDRDCPLILGSLLDAVSAGLRTLPNIQLPGLLRLADAERWGEAIARGLGWAPGTFSTALKLNRAKANEGTLEESSVAVAIIDLAIRRPFFRGTMQELRLTLIQVTPASNWGNSADWPKNPRLLSIKLRQLAPQLRSIGIDVDFVRDGQLRIVTVAMAERGDGPPSDQQSMIIHERFGVYIDEQNRAVANANRLR